MISYEEALDHILALPVSTKSESLGLRSAAYRFLAEDIHAPWPLPRFDNSAMDGFAFRAEDGQSAGEKLIIVGESAAGRAFSGAIGPGEAIRIATGAPVPPDAGTILPREKGMEEAPGILTVREPEPAGLYFRRAGSDVNQGQLLFSAGDRINPAATMLLASYNFNEVQVFQRPKVAILTSGDEIKPLGSSLGESEIIGSSLYYLEQELAACGCEARLFGIAADEMESFAALFAEALRWADLVVTTAGVSVGERDLLHAVVERFEGQRIFWRVAVRPGKPMLLSQFGDKPHFGFPGNPVSTCCNTEIFLKPYLRKWFGWKECFEKPELRRAAKPIPRDRNRLFFVYSKLTSDDGVTPLANQNSGNLHNPALADALAVIPPGEQIVQQGGIVDCLPLKSGL